MDLRFDHVIVAVPDLEAASGRLLEEHGLASVAGGRHVGHGTGNRIVPLGDSYIELMTIVDEQEATTSPLGHWIGTQIARGERLTALCLGTRDIDAVGERLGLAPIAMSRFNDDGSELSWRLVGLERAMVEPPHPFFIQWDVAHERHPGRLEAGHRSTPRGIAWVELAGSEGSMDEWIGEHQLDIRFAAAEPGMTRIGVATDEGEVVLLNETSS